MGPDKEIRQDTCFYASGPPIQCMDLGCHKKCRARYRQHLQTSIRYKSIEFFQSVKSRRQFGIDNVIDDQ